MEDAHGHELRLDEGTRRPLYSRPPSDLDISSESSFELHSDCRHFKGGQPCSFWRPCAGCMHYDAVESRVLIIMLGLLGDMLIASPLPKRLKTEMPRCHVTWIANPTELEVLSLNPYVDRLLPFDWKTSQQVLSETYDLVLGFEREPSAAALVDRVAATNKRGLAFGGPANSLYALDGASEHFFRMNTWNAFRTAANRKRWTEHYFEVAGLRYEGEPYELLIADAVRSRVAGQLPLDRDRPLIQLNVGSSLETKMWPIALWSQLGERLLEAGCAVVVTGGPKERELCDRLLGLLGSADPRRVAYRPFSIEEFCAVASFCTAVVTGDSFGYHVAVAHGTPSVVLFGPSSPHEVVHESLAIAKVLTSSYACSPCAHQVACGGVGGCMGDISPDRVMDLVMELVSAKRGRL